MTWIKPLWMEGDERVKKAIEEGRKLYPPEYATPVTAVFNAFAQSHVASHSLIPDALYNAFSTLGSLMTPYLPPPRRQHEMVTTIRTGTDTVQAWTKCSSNVLPSHN